MIFHVTVRRVKGFGSRASDENPEFLGVVQTEFSTPLANYFVGDDDATINPKAVKLTMPALRFVYLSFFWFDSLCW